MFSSGVRTSCCRCITSQANLASYRFTVSKRRRFHDAFVFSRKAIMHETGESMKHCLLCVSVWQSSMEASSITKPSFTDQHHGQQPGSSVVVLMEEQARGSKATGDQLQLLHCCGNAQVKYRGFVRPGAELHRARMNWKSARWNGFGGGRTRGNLHNRCASWCSSVFVFFSVCV